MINDMIYYVKQETLLGLPTGWYKQKDAVTNEDEITTKNKYLAVAKVLWDTNDTKAIYSRTDEEIKEYNDIPVYWCNTCKSLNIVNIDMPLNKEVNCYCVKCYSTDIKRGHIDEWLQIANKNFNNQNINK